MDFELTLEVSPEDLQLFPDPTDHLKPQENFPQTPEEGDKTPIPEKPRKTNSQETTQIPSLLSLKIPRPKFLVNAPIPSQYGKPR